jgi:polyisoprenoid-binding protein YceI
MLDSTIKKLLIAACIFVPMTAFSAVPTWKIVSDKSDITFSATQNGAPVTGHFKKFTGDIAFDPAQLNESHVQINVDMTSVTTSYGQVADTLKTADWFSVSVFPQAVFKADHFTKTGDHSYQADGKLTIRGKTLPVVLTFDIDAFSKSNAHATGSTSLKRTAFDVGQGDWAKTDEIKDDVTVKFILSVVPGN